MRAVIQRVNSASVSVEGVRKGGVSTGLVVLVGITQADGPEEAIYLADKVLNMRLFPPPGSDTGFELSALDVKAGVLLVSQFTLYASARKGRRPSFTSAAPGDVAGPLFERVVAEFKKGGLQVETGVFGAHMHVELENDGPVTIVLDTDERLTPRG